MDKIKEDVIKTFNTKNTVPIVTKEEALAKKEIIANKAADTQDAQKKQAEQDVKDLAQKELEQKSDPTLNTGNQFGKAAQVANNAISPAIGWLANAPTPGGIATIFLVLLFFLFAIIPVDTSGNTRMKLLWLTLTGKTHLNYATDAKGGGADFGNNTPVLVPPVQGARATNTAITTTNNSPAIIPLSAPLAMSDVFSFLGVE